jgi:beta-phosphoglucomutase-like phosphatase (HAD superfamily)
VRLVDAALEAGWTLAVASTASEDSVRVVLETVLGPRRAARFAVFAGDVVSAKKPDPAIYELALERLRTTPAETIVVEDSRNGLLAAVGAGLRCVITVSHFTAHEDFAGAALVVSSLGDPAEPTTIVANRSGASPGAYVTLGDLAAVLETPAPDS